MDKPILHGNTQDKGFNTAQKKGFTKQPGIREVYTPTDQQRETFNFVYNERYRRMRDAEDREKFLRGADRWEKQWEGFRVERKEADWQSNHVVPITISVVQTALSELVRQNMRPFLRARGPADVAKITLLQHIWDYGWEVSNSDLLMYDVLQDMLIYGIGITQEYYKKDYVHRFNRSVINGKEHIDKERILKYDDVAGEIVKPQEFFVDELARDFDGPFAARDCIRRYIMDIDAFHELYDGSIWDQFGNADKVRPGGDTSYYEFYRPPEGIDTSRQVEVLHYWAERPVDRWVIIANEVVVRDKDNPYKHKKLPFSRAVDIKRVHKFYPKGEPELLESIQDEANTLRRMIIDRNHLDIDKMFLVSNKLGLDDEDTIARPHGIIPTDDVNGAKAIEYGDIPRSVTLSLQNLEDDSTIATGINPRAQALPQAGTATEAAILKESTLRRIETKLWLFRKIYLRRLGELRLSNMLQFYSEPTLEKIVGDEADSEYQQQIMSLQQQGRLQTIDNEKFKVNYRTIPIQDKSMSVGADGAMSEGPANGTTFFQLKSQYFMPVERGGYDIRFDAGPNIDISKPLLKQQDLELFDRLLQVAQIFPGTYDPGKLGDMILKDYDKNPKDIKPDQQVDPAQEANQRFQMQLNLAQMENQQLINGADVPSTPYASPAHTMVHVEFMHSPSFQKLDNKKDKKIIEAFTKHAIGEIMAQTARNQAGPGVPQGPDQQGPQGFAPPGGTTSPQFGPSQTTPTSVSQGITNRPGGMAQPKMRPGQVTPALNPGGEGPTGPR
jgi:hypothetical protein